MSEGNVISIKSLTKKYGDFAAVDSLSLQVGKGKIFGLLGHNGAGKSTTMRMLMSLIKPTEGKIEIFGSDPVRDHKIVYSKIGSIIERPDFYSWLSGLKNLELLAGLSQRKISRQKINETIDLVGLTGREKDLVSKYSHGMKQRLGLAQAVLHDPDLIILDEPTTGLDPQGIIDFRNLMIYFSKEQGKTILLSSHLLSEVEIIADDLCIIDKGKNIVQGSVKSLLSNESLVSQFKVDNIGLAKELLMDPKYQFTPFGESEFEILVSDIDIPPIIKLLVDKGVNIYEIVSKRKLEDFFLKMTTQG